MTRYHNHIIIFNISTLLLCFIVGVLTACNNNNTCAEKSSENPNIFPDYINTTIPQNIAPLNFKIKDATSIKAVVTSMVTTALMLVASFIL